MLIFSVYWCGFVEKNVYSSYPVGLDDCNLEILQFW